MSSLGEYLGMGGYGRFVWPAYGVTALLLLAIVLDTLRRRRRRLAELAELEARGAARRGVGERHDA
jgi:heme exporter protein D